MKYSFFKICFIFNKYFPVFHYFVYNIILLFQYNQNSEIKEYIEKLLDELREKHVVFDLEALLIKPVQRILKYPLLLNALFKVRNILVVILNRN